MIPSKKRSKAYLRLFDQQMSLYEHYARKMGLQSKSLFILLWLYYNPQGITQKQIARKTYSSKQVVSANLKRWAEKDYLAHRDSLTDKREKVLFLSEKGKAFAENIILPLERVELAALNDLSQQEQEVLIGLSKRYYQSLQEYMLRYFDTTACNERKKETL